EKLVKHDEGDAVEGAGGQGSARAGGGDDVEPAVVVEVGGGDAHAADKRGVIGEEALDHGAALAAESFDVGRPTRAGAGDDVGIAVAVHVPARDIDPAREPGAVGIETENHGAAEAVKRLDMRSAARSSARDDIGEPVEIKVGGGDAHTAR